MCAGKIAVVAGCLVVLSWAAYFSVMGVIAYVAYHFITKYW